MVGRIAARISENPCHMVFRFEPGDDDVEALELQVVTQQVDIAAGRMGAPVGDEVGGRAEFLAVVISDSLGVSDQRIGVADRTDSLIR